MLKHLTIDDVVVLLNVVWVNLFLCFILCLKTESMQWKLFPAKVCVFGYVSTNFQRLAFKLLVFSRHQCLELLLCLLSFAWTITCLMTEQRRNCSTLQCNEFTPNIMHKRRKRVIWSTLVEYLIVQVILNCFNSTLTVSSSKIRDLYTVLYTNVACKKRKWAPTIALESEARKNTCGGN